LAGFVVRKYSITQRRKRDSTLDVGRQGSDGHRRRLRLTPVQILCVPKTRSMLNQRKNRITLAAVDALMLLALKLLAASFKSKSRLEAENAALRHQLIVLRRKVNGGIQLSNADRLFFVALSLVSLDL
jgi:hypothetical protein